MEIHLEPLSRHWVELKTGQVAVFGTQPAAFVFLERWLGRLFYVIGADRVSFVRNTT